MGMAEAIPGVSGGTIAFITGIYRELIDTIRSITPANLRLLFSDFPLFWERVNGRFLLTLLAGMGAGIVFGVLVLTHFLETQQVILWAFFSGLVIASAVYLSRSIKWSLYELGCFVLGAILTYMISTLVPTTGSDNLLYVFLAGAVSVSALMLPGVSGSFMLVLFGLYHTVMYNVKDLLKGEITGEHIAFFASFVGGLLIGLFSFARVLSYLFRKFPQATMAALTGVLLGSLPKIWPWKIITSIMDKTTGASADYRDIALPAGDTHKILTELNVMPSAYSSFAEPQVLAAIIAFVVGIAVVAILSRFEGDDMV